MIWRLALRFHPPGGGRISTSHGAGGRVDEREPFRGTSAAIRFRWPGVSNELALQANWKTALADAGRPDSASFLERHGRRPVGFQSEPVAQQAT
jgi:hypothetical protein